MVDSELFEQESSIKVEQKMNKIVLDKNRKSTFKSYEASHSYYHMLQQKRTKLVAEINNGEKILDNMVDNLKDIDTEITQFNLRMNEIRKGCKRDRAKLDKEREEQKTKGVTNKPLFDKKAEEQPKSSVAQQLADEINANSRS